jgi:hypothetical protein
MLALLLNKTEALLDVPILIQDGIIIALFTGALGFMLYKKLRRKEKSCPACAGDCASDSKPLRTSGK